MEKRIRRPRSIRGQITPPADKSISHRSLIFNSIADGQAHISNFLPAADCLSTLGCLRALGVQINQDGTEISITGRGREGFVPPKELLDAGNSGTTLRLLTGLLASQPFESVITGDKSLCSRPMGRIILPLTQMGAHITAENNRAPLTIAGGSLKGIEYTLPVASAQVKSALLMAALFAEGRTVITEPARSRDHTERMLRAMGANLVSDGLVNTVTPTGAPLVPLSLRVPGDISSAAFWLVAGAIHPDAEIHLLGVGINPTRSGVIEVLKLMGARISVENERLEGEEPVADLVIRSSRLKGADIGGDIIPRIIDEIPVIAVAASVASGVTTIKDAGELRVKESDRIMTTVTELSKLGAKIEESADGMIITGVPRLKGGKCKSHFDHRLAMAMAVAGLVTQESTLVSNAEAVSISYPEFWEDLDRLSG